MHGIHEMDITQKGFHKIISTINVHFRRMIKAPVHLTYEPTQDIFHRLNQPMMGLFLFAIRNDKGFG